MAQSRKSAKAPGGASAGGRQGGEVSIATLKCASMTAPGKISAPVEDSPPAANLPYLSLLLLVVVIPWSVSGYSIGFALAVFTSLPSLWRGGWRRAHLHPFFLPSLVWGLALLLSFFWSDGPRAGDEARTYYPFLLTFVASACIRQRRQLRQLVLAFLATASVAGFLSFCTNCGWLQTEEDRFSGPVSIFTFAMVMATAYVLGALFFSLVKTWRQRILLWLASFLLLDGVFMNESRATVLAIGLGFLVLLIGLQRQRKSLFLYLAPVLLAVPVVLPGSAFLERFQATASELNLQDEEVHPREVLWIAAGRMMQQHPWMGVGIGAYRSERERMFADGEMDGFVLKKKGYETAHSVLLHIGATMGVVGLLAFLFWASAPVLWFWHRRQQSWPIPIAALALCSIVFGFGLTDMCLLNSRISGIFAIGLGAAFGVVGHEERL